MAGPDVKRMIHNRLFGLAFAVLLIAALACAGYWFRPSHRVTRILDAVERAGNDDLESAERALRRAVQIAPDHDAAQFALVKVLLARGKHDDALEILESTRLVTRNPALWQEAPSLLQPLKSLALRTGNATWQQAFAAVLTGSLDRLAPETLIKYAEMCLHMGLTSPAWQAILRVQEIDPEDPGPFLLAAAYPGTWAELPTFMSTTVPQQDGEQAMTRDELLNNCLARIAAREADGVIPRRMAVMRVRAFTMLGQHDKALEELDRIEKAYPGDNSGLVPRRAALLYSLQRWDSAYELLRQTDARTAFPVLTTREMLVRSALQLGLGLPALIYAEDSVARLPSEPRAAMLLAQVWAQFGSSEDALYILAPDGKAPPSPFLAFLLERTGRIIAADAVRHRLGIEQEREIARRNPGGRVPPAERAVTWIAPPAPTNTAVIATSFRGHAERTASPFMKGLHEHTADWYASPRTDNKTVSLEKWAALGRDPLEKAAALHRLGRLQAEADQHEEALRTVERAIDILPAASLLWRMRVALTEGDESVTVQAYGACPHDPVIWLARLIAMVRGDASEDVVSDFVTAAVARGRYAPGAFVRAGTFLLENKQLSAATIAAQQAQQRAPGFLPAHDLAMRCAKKTGDPVWVMQSALQAANMAIWHTSYLRTFARAATQQYPDNPELAAAIQALLATTPIRPEWPDRLAAVQSILTRLQTGDNTEGLAAE